MKYFLLSTISSLFLSVFAITGYTTNLRNSAEIVALAEKNPVQTQRAVNYKSPEAATKAFIMAWRRKNRAAMLKVAEKGVVKGIGNLMKGSTFRGCQVNTESAQKAYHCTVQAGNDDLKAIYLEVVLTRIGYRIMSIDYAAH